MTALIVILLLVVLVVSALLIPLKADIDIKNSQIVKISYAGIKLYPRKNKTSHDDNSSSKNNNISASKSFIKRFFANTSFSQKCLAVIEMLKAIMSELAYIIKRIKIDKFCIDVVVGGDDAARIAIEYGQISTAVYNLLSLIGSLTKLDISWVNIFSEFSGGGSKFDLSLSVRLCPLFAIIATISAVKKIIIIKKDVLNNERK